MTEGYRASSLHLIDEGIMFATRDSFLLEVQMNKSRVEIMITDPKSGLTLGYKLLSGLIIYYVKSIQYRLAEDQNEFVSTIIETLTGEKILIKSAQKFIIEEREER